MPSYIESGPSSFILESGPTSLQVSQKKKSSTNLSLSSVFGQWCAIAGKSAWDEVCLLRIGGRLTRHSRRGFVLSGLTFLGSRFGGQFFWVHVLGRVALHATEEVETVDQNDFVLTAAPGDGSCSDVWGPPLANFLNTSSIFLFVRDYITAPSSSIVVFICFALS